MSKLKDLREKRANVATQMAGFLTEMTKEGVTTERKAELRTSWDKANKEVDDLKGDIDRIEAQDKLESETRAQAIRQEERGTVLTDDEQKVRESRYRKSFFESMKQGEIVSLVGKNEGLNGWNRAGNGSEARRRALDEYRQGRVVEMRDQQAGTQSLTYTQGAAGGFFVPAGFVYDVEIATKYFAPIADGKVIKILETATGNLLPYPTNNDTSEAWSIIGEASQVSDQGQTSNYPTSGTAPSGQAGNLTMGVVNFGAWKGSTGLVRVSLELLQDSAFDLEDFLKQSFAVRLGRGYEFYLTRGTGVNQPTGILTAVKASGQAATIATGSSTNDGSANTGSNSIGSNDLISLEHSIDPTYRRGARFMLHDNTLKTIKQLLDKYGRPLWVPGLSVNAPDTILGYEYVINQSMPQIAAAADTVLFGSLQKFIMRKVRDLSVLRLDERFADFGEVAFIGFSRIDSNLVDAGVHPIGFLEMHS